MKISPDDLIPFNAFEKDYPVIVHMAYADEAYEHNYFKGLYYRDAKIMWGHKDFVAVTILAAKMAKEQYGWSLELKDCLRPVEAQEAMKQYGFDPTLVSLPGFGAHPRAMAIDICPRGEDGGLVDMGTVFDHFAPDPKTDNPAARNYTEFDCDQKGKEEILLNRKRLESCMRDAGAQLGHDIFPLPQEWWDFRFPARPKEDAKNKIYDLSDKNIYWDDYLPLHEADLAPYQRVINPDLAGVSAILAGNYPPSMREAIESVKKRI